MLILSRRKDETIVIDDKITVRILKTTGRTVKIGVEAERGVPVVRGELNAKEPRNAKEGR